MHVNIKGEENFYKYQPHQIFISKGKSNTDCSQILKKHPEIEVLKKISIENLKAKDHEILEIFIKGDSLEKEAESNPTDVAQQVVINDARKRASYQSMLNRQDTINTLGREIAKDAISMQPLSEEMQIALVDILDGKLAPALEGLLKSLSSGQTEGLNNQAIKQKAGMTFKLAEFYGDKAAMKACATFVTATGVSVKAIKAWKKRTAKGDIHPPDSASGVFLNITLSPVLFKPGNMAPNTTSQPNIWAPKTTVLALGNKNGYLIERQESPIFNLGIEEGKQQGVIAFNIKNTKILGTDSVGNTLDSLNNIIFETAFTSLKIGLRPKWCPVKIEKPGSKNHLKCIIEAMFAVEFPFGADRISSALNNSGISDLTNISPLSLNGQIGSSFELGIGRFLFSFRCMYSFNPNISDFITPDINGFLFQQSVGIGF